ncbi:MAG: nucleoside triphosphate pyrophosphatase [Candidatus Rhabdochlamydia sp.]
MRIILGSESKSRREILSDFSLPFEQVPSHFDEESVKYEGDPKNHALTLALKKSETLGALYPHDVILTADSVVTCQGNIYNKPVSQEEAFNFLMTFSGNWQSVFTAVAVRKGEDVYSHVEETKLLFNPLTPYQIQQFHSYCQFMTKAGGYGIEKCGNLIISRLEGSYDNVLGLPVNSVQKLLLQVGIDLWDYLKPLS